jgi:hypothetical protein
MGCSCGSGTCFRLSFRRTDVVYSDTSSPRCIEATSIFVLSFGLVGCLALALSDHLSAQTHLDKSVGMH